MVNLQKKRPEEPASSAIVKEPLFGGSIRTLFDALLQLFSRFCDHPSISKSTFSENLAIQLSLLPPDNVLPSCFQVARKAITPCLIQTVKYDACKMDHKDATNSPVCGESRADR